MGDVLVCHLVGPDEDEASADCRELDVLLVLMQTWSATRSFVVSLCCVVPLYSVRKPE